MVGITNSRDAKCLYCLIHASDNDEETSVLAYRSPTNNCYVCYNCCAGHKACAIHYDQIKGYFSVNFSTLKC